MYFFLKGSIFQIIYGTVAASGRSGRLQCRSETGFRGLSVVHLVAAYALVLAYVPLEVSPWFLVANTQMRPYRQYRAGT